MASKSRFRHDHWVVEHLGVGESLVGPTSGNGDFVILAPENHANAIATYVNDLLDEHNDLAADLEVLELAIEGGLKEHVDDGTCAACNHGQVAQLDRALGEEMARADGLVETLKAIEEMWGERDEARRLLRKALKAEDAL
jgi:hypothetical protein